MPILKKGADQDAILAATQSLHDTLVKAGIRSKLDNRLDASPGFKYNEYELRVRCSAVVPATAATGPSSMQRSCSMHSSCGLE